MRAIQSRLGRSKELELVVECDPYLGECEARLLSDRVCGATRTDDVTQRIDGGEALILNQEAIDRSSEPFRDGVAEQCVTQRIAGLEVHEFIRGAASRSDVEYS